jgi:hypothetical protein
MSESTGRIVFINSADYVSDVTGTDAVGSLATLRTDDGKAVDVFTQSSRLQHTLEMAYATGRRVAVDYTENPVVLSERRGPSTGPNVDRSGDDFEGPFKLQVMWTLE